MTRNLQLYVNECEWMINSVSSDTLYLNQLGQRQRGLSKHGIPNAVYSMCGRTARAGVCHISWSHEPTLKLKSGR